jgi:hypothetical protein
VLSIIITSAINVEVVRKDYLVIHSTVDAKSSINNL